MDIDAYVRLAREAATRRDWSEALALWDNVAARDPTSPLGPVGKGEVLLEMGKLAEAEAVFVEAMQRFPSHVWAAGHHARIASLRQEWQEALRRWQSVRDLFPYDPAGYLGYGETLRDVGELDQAKAIFADAMERFPEHIWPAAHYAILATHRQERQEAVQRWRNVRDRFPDEPLGYLGYGEALRDAGCLEEAGRIFADAAERFPENDWAAVNFARIASQQRDWAEAVRRWDLVLERFPRQRIGYTEKADALLQAGRFEDAEATLREGLRLFPDNDSLAGRLTELASLRDQYQSAQRWWQRARQWFSRHGVPYTGDPLELCGLSASVLGSPDHQARLLTEVSLLEDQQRPELQAALFEQVLAEKPIWDFWIFHRLTRAYETLGRAAASYLVASAALRINPAMPVAETLFRVKFEYLTHHQLYAEAIEVFREAIRDAPESPIAEMDEIREVARAGGIFLDKTLLTSPSCRSVRVIDAEMRPAWSCPVYGSTLPPALLPLIEAEGRPPIDVVLLKDAELFICNGATVVVDSTGMTVVDLSVADYPALVRKKIELLLRRTEAEEITADVVVQINDSFPAPNYCHFLLDQVTRLELYRRAGVEPGGALAICPMLGAEFQHEILGRLGIVNAIGVNRVARVKARELWVSTNCRDLQHPAHAGASWAIDFLRHSLAAAASGEQSRIYLSRGDAIGRRVHNEEEVVRELERRGFAKIVPGQMSFAAQTTAMANATHVVAVHGAALTNAIFAQPNCAVLEMFHPLYGSTGYAALARAAQWRYAALTARDWQFDTPEYNDPDLREVPHGYGQRNIFVDLELLRHWLDDTC